MACGGRARAQLNKLTSRVAPALPVLGGNGESGARALEAVEDHQAAAARELFGAGDDHLDVGRMQDRGKGLARAKVELGELVEQAGQLVLVDGPARGSQSRADLQHDRIDRRVAVENVENPIEVALVVAHPDRPARVEWIAIASADDVEEAFQLRVRRVRKRR